METGGEYLQQPKKKCSKKRWEREGKNRGGWGDTTGKRKKGTQKGAKSLGKKKDRKVMRGNQAKSRHGSTSKRQDPGNRREKQIVRHKKKGEQVEKEEGVEER